MLSSALRSERAIQVNIAIIKAFIKLRHAMTAYQGLTRRVDKLEGKIEMHETDIRLLVRDVQELQKRSRPNNPITPTIL